MLRKPAVGAARGERYCGSVSERRKPEIRAKWKQGALELIVPELRIRIPIVVEAVPQQRSLYEFLTHRQRQIAALIFEGMENKEIAGRLGIENRTVKFHVSAIYEMTGTRNRKEFMAKYPAGLEAPAAEGSGFNGRPH